MNLSLKGSFSSLQGNPKSSGPEACFGPSLAQPKLKRAKLDPSLFKKGRAACFILGLARQVMGF